MTQQTQSQPQSQPPSSPLSTKPKHHAPTTIAGLDPSQIIPSTDPRRTTPLHATLPLKTSADPTLHPLTLAPYTPEDLKHHTFHALRSQFATADAARRARDEAAAELAGRIEEAERRTREVEREIEEKEKIRETERRVWMKRRGEVGG